MPRVTARVADDVKPRDGQSRKGPELVETRSTGVQQSGPIPNCQDEGMEDVIERLRASKYDRDTGKAAGEKWAKQKAEYGELEKLDVAAKNLTSCLDDPSLDSDVFLRAIGVDPEKGPSFWAEAGYPGRGKPPMMFVHGFCRAAEHVFEEVVDKL